MKLILKTKDDKQLAVVECWVRANVDYKYIGISSFVNIENYSKLLIDSDEETRKQLIKSFSGIAYMKKYLDDYNDYSQLVAECRNILRRVNSKYGFVYQEK